MTGNIAIILTEEAVTKEAQEDLEKTIRKNVTDLGFALYKVPVVIQSYLALIHIQKQLIEYFDNTRLLANKPNGE